MAKRIQRSRRKGWRMPDGAIYVGRPTLYGNPFDTAHAYREWLLGSEWIIETLASTDIRRSNLRERRRKVLEDLPSLKGHDLVCWCPLTTLCHADVLLELLEEL